MHLHLQHIHIVLHFTRSIIISRRKGNFKIKKREKNKNNLQKLYSLFPRKKIDKYHTNPAPCLDIKLVLGLPYSFGTRARRARAKASDSGRNKRLLLLLPLQLACEARPREKREPCRSHCRAGAGWAAAAPLGSATSPAAATRPRRRRRRGAGAAVRPRWDGTATAPRRRRSGSGTARRSRAATARCRAHTRAPLSTPWTRSRRPCPPGEPPISPQGTDLDRPCQLIRATLLGDSGVMWLQAVLLYPADLVSPRDFWRFLALVGLTHSKRLVLDRCQLGNVRCIRRFLILG